MAPTRTRPRIDYLALARDHATRRRTWIDELRFDPQRRWYTCLDTDPQAQVWLLTWLPGQGTDLHDHGGSAGALVVVEGVLTEQSARQTTSGVRLTELTMGPGHGHRFGPRFVHRITNAGAAPAVSIHVYGPALTSMTRYRMVGGGLRVVEVDRAGVAW